MKNFAQISNIVVSIKMLTLELARDDSPQFRAILDQLEDEVDRMSVWLESLVKALRSYLEHWQRLNEASSTLALKLTPPPKISANTGTSMVTPSSDGAFALVFDQQQAVSDNQQQLHLAAESLQCASPFGAKLCEDLQTRLLEPLTTFLKQDLRSVREYRRVYERNCERFEQGMSRHLAISRSKRDPSAIREDAFQLFDMRKVHIRSSLDYTVKILSFKAVAKRLLCGSLGESILQSLGDFHRSVAELMQTNLGKVAPIVSTDGDVMIAANEQYLLDRKAALEDILIDMHKPSSDLPFITRTSSVVSSDTFTTSFQTTTSSQVTRTTKVSEHTPLEKEGYLHRRIQKPLQAPYWMRRWCYIRDGKFAVCSVARSQRGYIVSTQPVSVLLLELKLVEDKYDRRWCFELASKWRTYVLQAESHHDFVGWCVTFEASRLHAAKSGMAPKDFTPDELESFTGAQDDEDMQLTWLVSRKEENDDEASDGDEVPNESKEFRYLDERLRRRNVEMHQRVKDIPEDELLIETFPASLQTSSDESPVNGRFYITAAHLVFYSHGLSEEPAIVKILGMDLVRRVLRRVVDGHNVIVIVTEHEDFDPKASPHKRSSELQLNESIITTHFHNELLGMLIALKQGDESLFSSFAEMTLGIGIKDSLALAVQPSRCLKRYIREHFDTVIQSYTQNSISWQIILNLDAEDVARKFLSGLRNHGARSLIGLISTFQSQILNGKLEPLHVLSCISRELITEAIDANVDISLLPYSAFKLNLSSASAFYVMLWNSIVLKRRFKDRSLKTPCYSWKYIQHIPLSALATLSEQSSVFHGLFFPWRIYESSGFEDRCDIIDENAFLERLTVKNMTTTRQWQRLRQLCSLDFFAQVWCVIANQSGITFYHLMRQPLLLLVVDQTIYSSPVLLTIQLDILYEVICAIRVFVSQSMITRNTSRSSSSEDLDILLKRADSIVISTQRSVISALLSAAYNSDLNPECKDLIYSFLQRVMVRDDRVLRLVHFYGYNIQFLSDIISGTPCLTKLHFLEHDLLTRLTDGSAKQQIFKIRLFLDLTNRFRRPKWVAYCENNLLELVVNLILKIIKNRPARYRFMQTVTVSETTFCIEDLTDILSIVPEIVMFSPKQLAAKAIAILIEIKSFLSDMELHDSNFAEAELRQCRIVKRGILDKVIMVENQMQDL